MATSARIATNLERYGATTFASSKISTQSNEVLRDCGAMDYLHHFCKKSVTSIASMLEVSPTTVSRWMCIHGISVSLNYSYVSIPQQAVCDYIRSILPDDVEIITNTRSIITPYELDMYIPSLNIAIEYDGIYWHTEGQGKDRHYHLRKWKMCKEKGIQLIQIWSSDWNNMQQIVMDRLKYKLSPPTERLYARKCELVVLSTEQERVFLNHHHLQGYIASTICYGLKHNGNVVSIMSFGRSRYDTSSQWELLRYVTNEVVIGGARRLFSNFISQYNATTVVSYSMNRWNTGSLYEQLGMVYSHRSSPNYYYVDLTDPDRLLSRVQFQKHKLQSKLDVYDSTLSEWMNMELNGYDRIWDCGNDVYKWSAN